MHRGRDNHPETPAECRDRELTELEQMNRKTLSCSLLLLHDDVNAV